MPNARRGGVCVLHGHCGYREFVFVSLWFRGEAQGHIGHLSSSVCWHEWDCRVSSSTYLLISDFTRDVMSLLGDISEETTRFRLTFNIAHVRSNGWDTFYLLSIVQWSGSLETLCHFNNICMYVCMYTEITSDENYWGVNLLTYLLAYLLTAVCKVCLNGLGSVWPLHQWLSEETAAVGPGIAGLGSRHRARPTPISFNCTSLCLF